MATVTLPYTLTAGTPENVNNLVSNLNALVTGVNTIDTTQIASSVGNFGAWTAYTPTLTASVTNPTLGITGTATGHYAQIGKTVIARWKIYVGHTTSGPGSGAYYVALPVAASTGHVGLTVGNGYGYDASSTSLSAFTAYCDNANRLAMLYNTTLNGAYTLVGAATPWSWAYTDYLEAAIQYEAA
jgi:hypothetical protein